MVLASLVSFVSGLFMILSNNFWSVAFAIGFSALSYNLESGTREALAYDSLKFAGQEEKYNKFASTEMMLYRITSSTATLCAGFALWLGYRKAYAFDIIFLTESLKREVICVVFPNFFLHLSKNTSGYVLAELGKIISVLACKTHQM